MRNMEHKYLSIAVKTVFMAVAVLMYYFLTEVIDFGLYITYRHVFALVLFAIAFMVFLYKPNAARAVVSIKATTVYCVPLVITLMVSLYIWFAGLVDTSVINRGLSSSFVYTNMISFTLAAVAFLYIFGEKGMWYNLIAILISNLFMLLTIIAQNGIGAFFSQLITLIITFADESGSAVKDAEIHELAFCVGAYLVYMLLKPRKKLSFFILLGLSLFCFAAAFKRIGMVAVAGALVLAWLLRLIAKFKKELAMRVIVVLTILLVIILIAYVWIIKMDLFSLLEKIGINTSGRANIYNAVDKFYEFSPEFLGNGIGFLTYQLNTYISIGVNSVHNDFLQHYIDLGFWGYILWLLSMTLLRVCYFGAKGKTENAIIAFALTVYLVIVSSTDNTLNYPLFTTAIAILMIGPGFDEQVRSAETKIFGYISNVNKNTGGDSLL